MATDEQLGNIARVVGDLLENEDLNEEEREQATEILDKVRALAGDEGEEEGG